LESKLNGVDWQAARGEPRPGAHTAGAALPSTFDKLPNRDGFQYAAANYISAGGQPLEGSA